jgi:hypothetical protein
VSRRARLSGALIGIALSALAAAPAQAHFGVFIREVSPALLLGPQDAFVELQSHLPGQQRIGGLWIDVYGPTGAKVHTFFMDAHHPPHDESQRSILIADSGVAGADYEDPDLGTFISPSGGAVCFFEALPADCVAWGSISNQSQLPFPRAGDAAPAIPDGSSLTRTIARGCPTALDRPDDSDDSADDFAVTPPTPRANSAAPDELLCVRCDGLVATHVGTVRADTIVGTPSRDVIASLYGKDVVRGRGGNDLICGGASSDRLFGGKGRDRLLGGGGRDRCVGGPGRDAARACETKRGV